MLKITKLENGSLEFALNGKTAVGKFYSDGSGAFTTGKLNYQLLKRQFGGRMLRVAIYQAIKDGAAELDQ